jgi:pimeloyl-ACP methyl ester carboxylesterase
VRALVLVSGPYERAVSGYARSRAAEAQAVGALRAGPAASFALNALSRRVLGAPGMSRVLARVGILAHDNGHFEEVLAEFSKVDWGRYFTMARLLHAHSAAAYLSHVRVPTLITAGTRDLLTPLRIAEEMHAKIPGSELYVVPGATHYVVAEFPDLLTDRIGEFLERVERG